MKIDEAGFQAAREHAERIGWLPDDGTEADRQDGYRQLREILSAYLDALPPAAPGRDRIAAVIDETGYVVASSATYAFRALQERLEAGGSKGPFEHFYISGNWPRPKPAEPVEVSGTVEGVTP